jgi:hypothetical protein
MESVKVWQEEVIIPTYSIGKPEKKPIFLEKRVYQGSSGAVYPHPVIEKIEDEKKDKSYQAIFLENKYLKIMVLPELGGRIQMAFDKVKNRHFIYYNQVIKPALESVKAINQSMAGTNKVSYKAVFEKAVLPAVIVGITIAVFQQLCGINVVFNYTPKIFASIGASQDDQLLQTVFIGAVNLTFTFLAMVLVDKLGRKPLMLIGSAGLAVLYVVIVWMLKAGSENVSWFLLTAIGVYAMSLAPVTWVLISEIFPNKVRSVASTIAILSLWLAYFVLVFTFPILFESLGDNTFYIYAVICALGFLFMYFKVKETKGKTLEELENVMMGH